jgi:hypothetical protein
MANLQVSGTEQNSDLQPVLPMQEERSSAKQSISA